MQVCLILKEESIRNPKWIILPRKSTFQHVKCHLRELFPWLKEYQDDDLRIWRLNLELSEHDFIDQFNRQLASKQVRK